MGDAGRVSAPFPPSNSIFLHLYYTSRVVAVHGGPGYHGYMENQYRRNLVPYDRPATYQIRVQGRIDPAWSDHLEGMAIHPAAVEAGPPVTTLEGELSDQAALAGVLNTLYELHLPILLVTCLKI
jgi:hypothetical protein